MIVKPKKVIGILLMLIMFLAIFVAAVPSIAGPKDTPNETNDLYIDDIFIDDEDDDEDDIYLLDLDEIDLDDDEKKTVFQFFNPSVDDVDEDCDTGLRLNKKLAIKYLTAAKTGNKKVDKKIDHIIEHIQKSLNIDPKHPDKPWKKNKQLWINDTHLHPKYGKYVFKEEQKAVKHLMHLIKEVPKLEKKIAEYEAKCDKCKGITSMTLSYKGGKGADITVGDEGKCKGITKMILSYTGGKGAAITASDGVVNDNDDGTYTITPKSGETKLKANTNIYVSGKISTTIHTSCSKPLNVNDVYGSFTVVGLDKLADGKAIVKDNGDGTYTITPAPGETKLESNTKIYIDGKLHTTIHTSCSKPINVDDVHGDFKITALEKIGDTKCEESKCKGVTSLKLSYTGGKGADITVGDSKCKGITKMILSYTGGKGAAITASDGVVTDNDDGTYTITPKSGETKLKANTNIYVSGKLSTTIHTSCSKPIAVNDVSGSFTIVGLDKINDGNAVVTDNNDGTYTITPAAGKDKLETNTKIYIGGKLDTIIHTSCSKPINVNDVFGSFKVVGVEKIFEAKKPQKYIDELKAINCSLHIFKMAIVKLTQIDEILAKTAADDAKNTTVVNSKNQPKVTRELAKVKKEFQKAQKDLNNGRYDKAINHYKHAWEHSQHAIKHANKVPKPKK